MFKFKLSDGSELTVTLDLANARIQITQSRPSIAMAGGSGVAGTGGSGVPYTQQTLTVPLVDVKQIAEQIKKLRSYFS